MPSMLTEGAQGDAKENLTQTAPCPVMSAPFWGTPFISKASTQEPPCEKDGQQSGPPLVISRRRAVERRKGFAGAWSEICYTFCYSKEPNGHRFLTTLRMLAGQAFENAAWSETWSEHLSPFWHFYLKCFRAQEILWSAWSATVVRDFSLF